jgi:hypothetical protein
MNPCDWPGVGSMCQAAGGAVGALFEDGSIRVLSAVAQGIASFAALLLESLWRLIQRVSNPQTDAEFVQQWAGMIFAIALPITVMFMVFQVIQSVLRARGWNRTGVASAVSGAAVSIVGTAVSLPIVHGATRIVDGAADAMTGVILGDIDTLGDSFADAIGGRGVTFAEVLTQQGQTQLAAEGTAAALGGLIGVIVLGFLMIVGGIAVFAALLIRSLLLYAVVVTGPIAFLGLVWTPARAWFRRWCVAVVALIFTKLGVVVVFGLGISAMNSLDFGDGVLESIGRLLTGALLMLIASLVPLVAFRFFDFMGEQTVASMHAGAHASVSRTREALGHMDPRRIAARLHGSNGNGRSAPSHGDGRQTPGGQPSQTRQQAERLQQSSSGRGRGPSDPWKSDTKPGTSQPGARPGSSPSSSGAGWSRPAGAGAGAAAGAVVGAGVAVGQGVAAAGSRAGQQTNQQQPTGNASRPVGRGTGRSRPEER